MSRPRTRADVCSLGIELDEEIGILRPRESIRFAHRLAPPQDDRGVGRNRLLQAEAFAHQALQAGFVEKIVGEFFVGEHGEGGALGAGGEL